MRRPRAWLASLVFAALATPVACARTDILDDGSGGTRGLTTSSDGGPLDLCDPAGVRLCGAGCPTLAMADAADQGDAAGVCPGYGCVSVHDTSQFAPTAAGVCWADATATARYVCGTCADGAVCLQKSKDEIVCVPEDVCRALWALGVRDVCRYADFEPYDDRGVPTPSDGCPLQEYPPALCGGSCGPCHAGVQCVGRSPDHPFGVCRNQDLYLPEPQPSDFMSCDQCLSAVPEYATWACAVFDGAAPLSVRKQGGFCLELDACLRVGKALPGGLSCFDRSGTRLGP